jgi:hypothetical protein
LNWTLHPTVEIIVGSSFNGNNNDHLAGFVSLDFDGFSDGERHENEVIISSDDDVISDDLWSSKFRNDIPNKQLSVAIETDGNAPTDLVKALNKNQNRGEAFIITGDAPEGFSKVDIPFMDPLKHKGELPRVFIAPIGGPIPKGYKGKPLLNEPLSIDHNRKNIIPDQFVATTTEKILLIEDSESKYENRLKQNKKEGKKIVNLFGRNPLLRRKPTPTQKPEIKTTTTTQSLSFAQSQINNSFKLKLQQRKRPSLSQFYLKNKKRVEKLAEAKSKYTSTVSPVTYFNPQETKTTSQVKFDKPLIIEEPGTPINSVKHSTTIIHHLQPKPEVPSTTTVQTTKETKTTITQSVPSTTKPPTITVYVSPVTQHKLQKVKVLKRS